MRHLQGTYMNTNQINYISEPSFVPSFPIGMPDAYDHEPIADELGTAMRAIDALPVDTSPCSERMSAAELEELDLFAVRVGLSSFHVESLARALTQEGDLQPVLIIRRDGRAFLIDGRHRKRAYEMTGRGESIPVVEFQGSTQEALLEGQRRNKLHTMAMTKDERMNCAWKLVKLDAADACRFTLRQIMAVGVSRGQVTAMRKVLRELVDGFEHMTWKAAMRAYSKKPERQWTDEEIEEMNEAQAQEAADRFARTHGTRLADRPEVMARMIEIYTGRRIGEVVRILNERNSHEDDDDEFADF